MTFKQRVEQEIADSYRNVSSLSSEMPYYDKFNSSDAVVDEVMNKSDESLEFEVGYLKGLETALEYLGRVGDEIKLEANLKIRAERLAEVAHNQNMAIFNEPMDGDETEFLAKCFLEELDKLNGNC